MGALLEQIYRFFQQQATATAQLAEAQLAFERQEVPPSFIRADYWRVPAQDGAAANDRRGLTGSARLLRDLTELDQYAFGTDRRKLQLTKTFSLGELDPVAFQRTVTSRGTTCAWSNGYGPRSSRSCRPCTGFTRHRRRRVPPVRLSARTRTTALSCNGRVALLFSRRDGSAFEVQIGNLRYEAGARTYESGPVTTVDGLVSSRRATGFRFLGFQGLPAAGRWTLSFDAGDAQLRRRFSNREIEDALLVITYSGAAPDWPA